MASLIAQQLDVLLARDAKGALTHAPGPERRPAPRLFLGRSADGNVFGLRHDLGPAIAEQLEALLREEPALDAPRADREPRCRSQVCALLAPIEAEWRGPAYVLPESFPRDERARVIDAADLPAFRRDFAWVEEEFAEIQPVVAAFEAGRVAAVCHSPRGMSEQAAEAGVETLEAHRRRGLGAAAVGCWARAVQQSGRRALYSTSWQNHASKALASRLGARLYGEDWHLA